MVRGLRLLCADGQVRRFDCAVTLLEAQREAQRSDAPQRDLHLFAPAMADQRRALVMSVLARTPARCPFPRLPADALFPASRMPTLQSLQSVHGLFVKHLKVANAQRPGKHVAGCDSRT